MVIRKIKSDSTEYFAKVATYTYGGFKCSIYKLFWGIPIKVHEKFFLRGLFNNASEMIDSTVFDYEYGKLRS